MASSEDSSYPSVYLYEEESSTYYYSPINSMRVELSGSTITLSQDPHQELIPSHGSCMVQMMVRTGPPLMLNPISCLLLISKLFLFHYDTIRRVIIAIDCLSPPQSYQVRVQLLAGKAFLVILLNNHPSESHIQRHSIIHLSGMWRLILFLLLMEVILHSVLLHLFLVV